MNLIQSLIDIAKEMECVCLMSTSVDLKSLALMVTRRNIAAVQLELMTYDSSNAKTFTKHNAVSICRFKNIDAKLDGKKSKIFLDTMTRER